MFTLSEKYVVQVLDRQTELYRIGGIYLPSLTNLVFGLGLSCHLLESLIGSIV